MVCRYGLQIAAALVEAHSKGIVHRDLKPGNVMIAKSGVKVLDFGLAKSGQDETVTGSHMVVGTPAYMAPEQREGKPADARSDIYSFGCLLHEMSTGSRVVDSAQARSRRQDSRRIVSRCLEADPARRWQSAAELERELAGVIGRRKPQESRTYWRRGCRGAGDGRNCRLVFWRTKASGDVALRIRPDHRFQRFGIGSGAFAGWTHGDFLSRRKSVAHQRTGLRQAASGWPVDAAHQRSAIQNTIRCLRPTAHASPTRRRKLSRTVVGIPGPCR